MANCVFPDFIFLHTRYLTYKRVKLQKVQKSKIRKAKVVQTAQET
jgi:hypothetical protein